MLYVNAINNQIVAYPYTQTDLIWDNPSTSFPVGGILPASLAEWNVFPVHFADQPVVDALAQRVVELAPIYDGQAWIQQWAVKALSQDEINANTARQAAAVRADRGIRLDLTDWTQGADTPQAIKNKYVPYRQALRDVSAQPGFPHTVVWPTQE